MPTDPNKENYMKKIIKTFNPKLHPEYDYVDIKLYTLASDIGVSSRTIQRWLKDLEDTGFIAQCLIIAK